MQLVRYEAARAALQAAHDVDEVKDIRDKAQAMAAYAKQAKDTKLVEWASEIKVRAERRAGAMLVEMKVNGSRANGTENLKIGQESSPESLDGTPEPTLDSLGISKNQASRWQKVAAIPEKAFERAIEQNKQSAGVVTTAAVLRSATMPTRAAPPKEKKPKGDSAEVAKLKARIEKLVADLAENKEALAEMKELAQSAKAFDEKDDFKQMQILRLELRQVKRRRDELMAENSSLKKHIAFLQKKLDKK